MKVTWMKKNLVVDVQFVKAVNLRQGGSYALFIFNDFYNFSFQIITRDLSTKKITGYSASSGVQFTDQQSVGLNKMRRNEKTIQKIPANEMDSPL